MQKINPSLKMKPAIKKAWVKALRSGKFKKGTQALKIQSRSKKSPPKYCCLGVLCEVYKAMTGKGKWQSDSPSQLELFVTTKDKEGGLLPYQVAKWAGLNKGMDGKPLNKGSFDNSEDAKVRLFPSRGYNGHSTLVVQNDAMRRTFKQIANLVEKHL